MATFTFDGTSSITATKNDTVLITADPTTFTQATDNGSNVSLAFGANTLTITGTTLAANNLPNVFVQGGNFQYAGVTNTNGAGTGNTLAFANTTVTTAATTASSKVAVFGGLGRTDALDGNDAINVGGKGSFLVFGNAGNDTITQSVGAFDSTSTVNVFGDQGNDVVTFTGANAKASIFVGGGAGTDSISVINSGVTTIQGGLDSTDGADTITFNADATGAGGTTNIFGNGGADIITVGNTKALDATSTATIYGGVDNDSVTVTAATGAKATISVLGNEGADTINVTGFGNTYIAGGNQSGDQSADGNDVIGFTGSGTTLIYGNAGADNITATLGTADTTSISIYGGRGVDTITQTAAGAGKATVFIAGGEDGDIISAQGNGGGVTIYGGISSSDASDGADSISYGTTGTASTGSANIFGNGGNDTINIGQLGVDTTNTVTVLGGGGTDSINIGIQLDGRQALNVSGNEGADTFSIAKGNGQTVTISDFATGTAGDKLAITGNGAGGTLAVAGGTFNTLQTALDAASAAATGAASKAAAVVYSGSTYVVLDSTGGTFTAATDQAIKLTGVTDLGALASQTTITV